MAWNALMWNYHVNYANKLEINNEEQTELSDFLKNSTSMNYIKVADALKIPTLKVNFFTLTKVYYYMFTKSDFTDDVQKASVQKDIRLVNVDEMF